MRTQVQTDTVIQTRTQKRDTNTRTNEYRDNVVDTVTNADKDTNVLRKMDTDADPDSFANIDAKLYEYSGTEKSTGKSCNRESLKKEQGGNRSLRYVQRCKHWNEFSKKAHIQTQNSNTNGNTRTQKSHNRRRHRRRQ